MFFQVNVLLVSALRLLLSYHFHAAQFTWIQTDELIVIPTLCKINSGSLYKNEGRSAIVKHQDMHNNHEKNKQS